MAEVAPPAILDYDAGLGTLTVTLGSAQYLDVDEVVDDVALFFDGELLGRLVKLQALFPAEGGSSMRTAITDCLGPTVGRLGLALVAGEEDAIAVEVKMPRREWTRLRAAQWPALHHSYRSSYGLPALQLARTPVAGRDADGDALLVVATPDAGRGPAVVELPSPFAIAAGVEGAIGVGVIGRTVRLTARPLRGAGDVRLQAEVLAPTPEGGGPAVFGLSGDDVTAEVVLAQGAHGGRAGRIVVHLSQPQAEAQEPKIILLLRGAGQAVRRLVGTREPLVPAASWAGVHVGRTADRVFWRNTGKPPIEVVVVREGTDLWARGYVKKSRRSQQARVECHLRTEALVALAPNGRTDAEAGVLSATATVDRDGYFHVRLATVRTEPFVGDLVDRLSLEVG